MIEAIFFDFDGVILESVNIKTEAFVDLFSDWPEYRDDIVKLHVENGGMSRFEKFKIICEDMIDIPYDKDREDDLAAEFSDLVFQKVIDCPFVPGAEEFLKKWGGRLAMFVISGTPTDEIREIVRRRELDFAFQGVYGSPEKKGHWAKTLISENGFSPENCRFVGDAGSDLRAARETDIPFIGRVAPGEYDPFEEEDSFPRIEDLTNLESVIGLEE